ncbi:hypothetical protein COCMIDRAFT_8544 [Bipolaris oryzae ATCC 44560]|uniref:Uncharacterized protein n=1 Tax=Bipolaris oryzae ATCC 44560 TaxID=930090 RepID=W6YW62_COCMI|nr:uncharacterized protein COCMIDRAFT_8544 [Bipolaris oryzae ATCC 44560]EUC41790.1 hypothetical protein COCMIDRAFT_8544 [Bipolaris oryzae ATCC 44560]
MAIAYDVPLNAEEQASINVDALVNDSDNEPIRAMPITPLSSHFLEYSRRSTPTIPPGFTAPAIPKTVIEESRARPASRPMSRTASSSITPAVPVMPVTPVTPIRTSTPSKAGKSRQKGDSAEPATPTATHAATPATNTQPTTPSKVPTPKEAVVFPQTPKEPTPREASRRVKGEAETSKTAPETRKSISEAATKDVPKAKSTSKKNQGQAQTTPKKEPPKEPIQTPVAAATPTSSTKRQPPGKLDIVAATKLPKDEGSLAAGPGKADSQAKHDRSVSVTAAGSVPPSPAAVGTGSPIKRAGPPRTLRVVATPKTEVPPPLSATTAPPLPHIPTVDKLRSRQASIASVNQPGTPASELISDTASITSTSFSRASSPPPVVGKVGTAPVRKKTKSQAKKDRQERKKQIEEEQLEDNKSDVEVVQAPIIGRKKKAKKTSTNSKPVAVAAAAAAAAKSQPASPKPATVEDEHAEVPTATAHKAPSAKVSAAATPEPEPEREESKEKREHTAQSIMTDLQRTGELIASNLEFFKPLSSSLTHTTRNTQMGGAVAPPDLKLHFSEADLETLAKKKPLRLNSQDGKSESRTLITPGGKFFWGLSEELETKALELEKRIDELKGPGRFHARKQAAHSHGLGTQTNDVLPAIATALKEAGKKLNTNGGQQMPRLDVPSGLLGSTNLPLPPVQGQDASVTQAPVSQQQQTPADAGGYLNQYVLPRTDNPPPNQPRPEMAAVGGPPGAGTANMSVNANRFAKAAKAVVEGGAVGSTEIDGMGFMAADKLGGVFVQGLEALVGAGLGYQSTQEVGLDSNGNIMLGQGAGGLDMQGLMNAIETTAGMGGYSGNARRGRGSVLTMEEAEQAMQAARKEHDVLEKKLSALIKKNRKLALGAAK